MSIEHLRENLQKGIISMQRRKARLCSNFPTLYCVISGGEQVEFSSTSYSHCKNFFEFIPDNIKNYFDVVEYVPKTTK